MSARDAAANHAVITGVGALTPIGTATEPFWQSVLTGRHGVRPLRAFQSRFQRCTLACEVEDGMLPWLPRGDTTRAVGLAVGAAREALLAANVDAAAIDALLVGTTMGDLPAIEAILPDEASAATIADFVRAGFSERIATALDVRGPDFTIATACSAGNLAICHGAELIRAGHATRVLAGGADALSQLAFVGFARMRAMAAERCSPFDRRRDGMLLGEGAAFLVLEARASAEARAAPILASIAGVGYSCDAHHVSTPFADGRGVVAAVRAALADAAVAPDEIDYVCAHGTGTHNNDVSEARAYAEVFGPRRPYVSSLKALTGHTLGAAGAIEAVACTLALRDQRIVPAWNIDEPDPECEVALPLPAAVPERPLRLIVNSSSAFGGNNSALVLRAWS